MNTLELTESVVLRPKVEALLPFIDLEPEGAFGLGVHFPFDPTRTATTFGYQSGYPFSNEVSNVRYPVQGGAIRHVVGAAVSSMLLAITFSEKSRAPDLDFWAPPPPRSEQRVVLVARYEGRGTPSRVVDPFADD